MKKIPKASKRESRHSWDIDPRFLTKIKRIVPNPGNLCALGSRNIETIILVLAKLGYVEIEGGEE